MKRYDRILIAVLSLAPFISFAAEVDEEISKIFDRRQRQLSSPPKSLRARGASKDDARFQEGLNRVQRRMATTPEEPATDAVDDTADIPAAEGDLSETKVNAPLIPAAASTSESRKGKIVIIRESRREKRQGVLNSYSFDGNRAVGLGLVGGGAYGIFGAEVDLGFGAKWSGGFGVGTGMAYSTWGIYARKYFSEGPLSTFIQIGYANWNISGVTYREKAIYPEYLANLFFDKSPSGDFSSRKGVHLVYPSTGFLYQTKSGLAYSLALQYFINSANFTGALYAGTGMHFYF